MWDAKYSTAGNFPTGIPADKLAAWNPQIAQAVAGYSGPYEADIVDAYNNGRILGEIYPYKP